MTPVTSLLLISSVLFIASLFLLVIGSRRFGSLAFLASKQSRYYLTVLIISVFAILYASGSLILQNAQKGLIETHTQVLSTVVDANQDALRRWVETNLTQLKMLAQEPKLIPLVSALEQVYQQEEVLTRSDAQWAFREHFSYLPEGPELQDLLVINANGINIGSLENLHLGEVNPIPKQVPEIWAELLAGESYFVAPIPANQALPGHRLIKGKNVSAALFFATPIMNDAAEVVAILAKRLNPQDALSGLMKNVRIGNTGENFLFNKRGEMLTESRFHVDLIKRRYLEPNEQDILSVLLTNPEATESSDEPVLTDMAAHAIAGGEGVNMQGYISYLGHRVVGAWHWDEQLNLGIASEQSYEEVFKPFSRAHKVMLIIDSLSATAATLLLIALVRISTRSFQLQQKEKARLESKVEAKKAAQVDMEERLRQIIDSIPIALILKDINGYYQAVNKSYLNMLGKSEEEVLGASDFDLWGDSEATNNTVQTDLTVMYKRQSLKYQVSLFHNELAKERIFQAGKFPIFNQAGEISGIVGTLVDITELVETEQALKATASSLKFMEYAVENATYMVTWTDLKTGKIEYANRMARDFLQLTQEQIGSVRLVDSGVLMDEQDLSTYLEEVRMGPKRYQSFIQSTDGEPHPIDITSQIVEFDENEKIVLFGRDVSDQKALEMALVESKVKAESASNAKSIFLATMSHEIRTPLNGILGMIGLVRRQMTEPVLDDKLRIAQESAKILLTLINDLLDFSKIEAEKLELEYLDFNLPDLFNDVVNAMHFKVKEKQLKLTLDLSGIQYRRVRTDPTRLRQVLTNLIGNAIKFTEQGSIDVKASTQTTDNGNRLICHVTDTGIGIPEDQIDQLFDKFSQADASTTRKYGGTGLGLAICRQLCQLMGGDITAISTAGQGSTFTFDIALEAAESQSFQIISNHTLKGIRAIVVDASSINRKVFRLQLESWQINVEEASSFDGLVAHLLKTQSALPDIILLDSVLLGNEGLHRLKSTQASNLLESIFVILMTPQEVKFESEALSAAGINGVFSKPVSSSSLHDALQVVNTYGKSLRDKNTVITPTLLKSAARDDSEKQDRYRLPAGLKILLVEDNEVNQIVVEGLLAEVGLTCTKAQNGLVALNILREQPGFDLVLMDCQMPILDGYEATERIRRGEAGELAKELPIIAMTAHALEGDRERCLATGMTDFIVKPINESLFYETVIRYTGGEILPAETLPPESDITIVWPEGIQSIDHTKPPPFARFTDAYLSAIRVFIEDASDMHQRLKTAFVQMQADQQISVTHTLKSMAGNLGFHRLQMKTEYLNRKLNTGQLPDEKQQTELLSLLDVAIQDAQQILEINHSEASEADHSLEWSDLVQTIMTHLSHDEMVPHELIEAFRRHSELDDRSAFRKRVLTALNNFEYDNALALLKEMNSSTAD